MRGLCAPRICMQLGDLTSALIRRRVVVTVRCWGAGHGGDARTARVSSSTEWRQVQARTNICKGVTFAVPAQSGKGRCLLHLDSLRQVHDNVLIAVQHVHTLEKGLSVGSLCHDTHTLSELWSIATLTGRKNNYHGVQILGIGQAEVVVVQKGLLCHV
jgi:hypothetical protein